MSNNRTNQLHFSQLTRLMLAVGALSVLTACGGGDGDSTAAAPTPAAPPPAANPVVTLSGTVMRDAALKSATVCMDLNANGACEDGEPASAKTGADGTYSLSYSTAQVSAAQVAAASLIAVLTPGSLTDPNTTTDADDADWTPGRTYALRQVPGKAGQINPLTTLVAVGMAAGMSEAVARSNVALQLAIAQSKIDNYQDDPAFNEASVVDSARLMALTVDAVVDEGGTLIVGDQTAAIAATTGTLRALNYTDAANYFLRSLPVQAKAAGDAGSTSVDSREGKTAGVATDPATLYNTAYLTPTGWVRCDASVPLKGTVGNPSRGTFCNTEVTVGDNTGISDVSGRTMSSVVNEFQANSETNTINAGLPTTGLLAALGGATFPSGSQAFTRSNLVLNQSIRISSISNDVRPASENSNTLEQLIANRPASGVTLSTAAGSLSLGVSSSALRNLRVAFTGSTSATAGTVQFYECDLNAAATVASNCGTAATGTYAISTVNGARVMRFAGMPPTPASRDNNLYVEVQNAPTVIAGSRVFRARENKPDLESNITDTRRLNVQAGAAMRGQLGI